MDQKQLIKQLLDFNRTSFNNTFNTMKMFQEQAERMTVTLTSHPTLMPDDGKKIVSEWLKIFKTYIDEYQNDVNENFKKIEEYIE